MRLTRRVAPAMTKREGGGHIINISSVAGIEPNKKQAAYSAAKYGLTGWSKASFEVRAPSGQCLFMSLLRQLT
jgi:short-subunit dehydrogenase